MRNSLGCVCYIRSFYCLCGAHLTASSKTNRLATKSFLFFAAMAFNSCTDALGDVSLSNALFHVPERTGVCEIFVLISVNASGTGQTALHAPQ